MEIFRNIAANPNEKYDIKFEKSPDTSLDELSTIEEELYKDIENITNIIKSLKHTKDDLKDKYFNKLLTLAQVGFLGTSPSSKTAQISLEALKKEILLVEGQRIKNKYMSYLGIGAILSIGLCWALYGTLNFFFGVPTILKYFVVWSGAMVGTWISFGARKFAIRLEDLSSLEEDKMNIYIRLPYIGFCSIIFLLFLDVGFFSFSIGDISSEKINDTLELQFLAGILAGLLESKLGVNIYEKVQDITKVS